MAYNARYLSLLAALVTDSDERQEEPGSDVAHVAPQRSLQLSPLQPQRVSTTRHEGSLPGGWREPSSQTQQPSVVEPAPETAEKPSADAAKQEFIRARNRLYQRKCRGRAKDTPAVVFTASNTADWCMQRREQQLNDQIATISGQLRISTKNSRKLRDRRHTLIARLNAANSAKTDESLTAGDLSRTQAVCSRHSSAEDADGSEQVPDASGQEPTEQLIRLSSKHSAGAGEPAAVHDTQCSKHCEQVSVTQILQFLHQTAGPGDKQLTQFQPLARAVCDYQSQVCSYHNVFPRDVSWFVDFAVSSIPLTFTADVSTGECTMSLALAWHLLSAESMFLVREHATFKAAAAEPGSQEAPAIQNYLMPRNLDTKPVAPDAELLQNTFLRCGVNDRCPLAEVVDKVWEALLQKYHTHLPHATWHNVCMHIMRVLEDTIQGLRAESAGADGGGAPDTDKGGSSGLPRQVSINATSAVATSAPDTRSGATGSHFGAVPGAAGAEAQHACAVGAARSVVGNAGRAPRGATPTALDITPLDQSTSRGDGVTAVGPRARDTGDAGGAGEPCPAAKASTAAKPCLFGSNSAEAASVQSILEQKKKPDDSFPETLAAQSAADTDTGAGAGAGMVAGSSAGASALGCAQAVSVPQIVAVVSDAAVAAGGRSGARVQEAQHPHRGAAPPQPRGEGQPEGMAQQRLMGKRIEAMLQLMLCTHHRVVHSMPAPMDEGSAATGSEGGSSAAVQDPRGGAERGGRMALLANTAGFMCHMLLQHQPMAYRSSIVSCMTSHNWSHMKVTHLAMNLYNRMQLSPSQRNALSERWANWCRRRKAMSRALAAAVAALQRPLLQHTPAHACNLRALVAHACNLGAERRGEARAPMHSDAAADAAAAAAEGDGAAPTRDGARAATRAVAGGVDSRAPRLPGNGSECSDATGSARVDEHMHAGDACIDGAAAKGGQRSPDNGPGGSGSGGGGSQGQCWRNVEAAVSAKLSAMHVAHASQLCWRPGCLKVQLPCQAFLVSASDAESGEDHDACCGHKHDHGQGHKRRMGGSTVDSCSRRAKRPTPPEGGSAGASAPSPPEGCAPSSSEISYRSAMEEYEPLHPGKKLPEASRSGLSLASAAHVLHSKACGPPSPTKPPSAPAANAATRPAHLPPPKFHDASVAAAAPDQPPALDTSLLVPHSNPPDTLPDTGRDGPPKLMTSPPPLPPSPAAPMHGPRQVPSSNTVLSPVPPLLRLQSAEGTEVSTQRDVVLSGSTIVENPALKQSQDCLAAHPLLPGSPTKGGRTAAASAGPPAGGPLAAVAAGEALAATTASIMSLLQGLDASAPPGAGADSAGADAALQHTAATSFARSVSSDRAVQAMKSHMQNNGSVKPPPSLLPADVATGAQAPGSAAAAAAGALKLQTSVGFGDQRAAADDSAGRMYGWHAPAPQRSSGNLPRDPPKRALVRWHSVHSVLPSSHSTADALHAARRSVMRTFSGDSALMRATSQSRWVAAADDGGDDVARATSAETGPEGSRRVRLGTVGEGGQELLCTLRALQRVCDVHGTDEGMQKELALPFQELNEVQHAHLIASYYQLGVPFAMLAHVSHIASREVALDSLFGSLRVGDDSA